jgi:hypothetical protein
MTNKWQINDNNMTTTWQQNDKTCQENANANPAW